MTPAFLRKKSLNSPQKREPFSRLLSGYLLLKAGQKHFTLTFFNLFIILYTLLRSQHTSENHL